MRHLLLIATFISCVVLAAKAADEHRLTRENASPMEAITPAPNQRWMDTVGNIYSTDFARNYRYENAQVLIQWQERGKTLTGRLEATGLKPNFAYQVKITGDPVRDPEGFQIIGRLGRWLAHAEGTHHTEEDVQRIGGMAYIFFAYIVTDADGSATLDFSLEHSWHVLWNQAHNGKPLPQSPKTSYMIDATSATLYMLPKEQPVEDVFWPEYDPVPGFPLRAKILLPPRNYRASLTLTEESFHSYDRDGGWWATVLSLPIDFTILPD